MAGKHERVAGTGRIPGIGRPRPRLQSTILDILDFLGIEEIGPGGVALREGVEVGRCRVERDPSRLPVILVFDADPSRPGKSVNRYHIVEDPPRAGTVVLRSEPGVDPRPGP